MTETFRAERLLEDLGFARRLAASLVGDASLAEDLVQEGWREILRRPPRETTNLRGYWATLLRRLAWRQRRGALRRADRERLVARAEAEDPEDVTARLEVHRLVVDALARLEPPYRTPLLLRFLDELSAEEIAARLHLPVGTVRTRLRRGLVRLRERIAAEHPGAREDWLGAVALLAYGRSGIEEAARRGALGAIAGRTRWAGWLAGAGGLLGSAALVLTVADRDTHPSSPALPGGGSRAGAGVRELARLAGDPDVRRRALPGSEEVAAPDETPWLTGTVRARDGAAISDAEVTAYLAWYDGQRFFADERSGPGGVFRLRAPPLGELSPSSTLRILVQASAPGFRPALEQVAFGLAPREPLELELERGTRMLMRVLDGRGAPALNALVELVLADGEERRTVLDNPDGHGVFHLAPHPGEEVLSVSCWDTRYGAAYAERPRPSRRGEDVWLPDLVLEPLGRISGRAVHPDGTPVRDIRIGARLVGWDEELGRHTLEAARPEPDAVAPGATRAYAFTDGEGAFELMGLDRGAFLLSVEPDLVGTVVPCDTLGYELVVDTTRLLVSVTDAEGRLVRGVTVRAVVVDPEGAESSVQAVTLGERGVASLCAAAGSEVTVFAEVPGAAAEETRVVLSPSAYQTELGLRLRPRGAAGRLRVVLPEARSGPVPWRADLSTPERRIPIADLSGLEPDSEGVLEDLPEGEYAVRIAPLPGSGGGWLLPSAPERVRIRAGELAELLADFPLGGRLVLELRDAALVEELLARAEPAESRPPCLADLPEGVTLTVRLRPSGSAGGRREELVFRGVRPDPGSGTWSTEVGIPPGEHELLVQSSAYETLRRQVVIREGVATRELLDLVARTSAGASGAIR